MLCLSADNPSTIIMLHFLRQTAIITQITASEIGVLQFATYL